MVTCSLHGNPVFRNGGLTNPNPEIRLLAARKVMRTIRIGNFLGAEYLTYWVARDGFECQFAVPWERTYRYLIEGAEPRRELREGAGRQRPARHHRAQAQRAARGDVPARQRATRWGSSRSSPTPPSGA